ncbi:MAG TPA: hypothetical protein VJS64_02030, partial [Pyrinomonadaceae bacterium]|nr:hypothetical protein [Pyrinomonadaceae bacterium]
IMPTLPKNRWLTLADMTKVNGEVTVMLKANGQPIKSYKAQVTVGQILRLPRNALNFEPHTAFISPRFIDTSSGSNSDYKMFEMYWFRKQ